jgi:hypothetical protein
MAILLAMMLLLKYREFGRVVVTKATLEAVGTN